MTTHRRAYALVLAAAAGLVVAHNARAQGIRSPVPVAVRARLDVQVLASQNSGEWSVTSRAPSDPSRFMADLTAGNAGTGILYLKGVSRWRDADDALGRVRFRLDQGDYVFRFGWADSASANIRVFGDERRFFTDDLGTPLADDDVVDNFEHRIGGRADAGMESVRATYWIAALDNGDDRRTNQYAAARFAPRVAYAGVSYMHDSPADGESRAIAKAELAGYIRSATAILSFAESATGKAFPSGDWGGSGNGYAAASPSNAATFAEVRTHQLRVGNDHALVASYQYGLVGADYSDDLTRNVPGSVSHRAWVDWRHLHYALDARLTARREDLWRSQQGKRQEVDVTGRARLLDNSEWLVRGGVLDDETDIADDSRGFVHAAYARELHEFRGGLHVLVDDIGSDARLLAGADVRMNWSATSAISGRWIVADEPGAGDAFWVRLEWRPTRRTWVTLGYGREDRGDDVYFLEDRDPVAESSSSNVIALSIRGDL